MHLLNVTNFDYALMAALFCLILGISYSFRRSNPSSGAFLLLEKQRLIPWVNVASMSSFGLIEFVVLSGYGAYAGIPALWVTASALALSFGLYLLKFRHAGLFVALNTRQQPPRFILICYALLMLMMVAVAIAIMVTMLKSLLGWEFGNSTLSLLGIVTVCLIIGGVVAVAYTHGLVTMISTVVLVLVVFMASAHLLPSGGLLLHLQQTALSNHLPATAFTQLKFSANLFSQFWLMLLAACLIILINPLYMLKRQHLSANVPKAVTRTYQLLILALMLLVGICALATPGAQTIIAGKKIITQQTRLDDGSMGYIVKAVPLAADDSIVQKGLVPQLSTEEVNSFDYLSAALVMIKNVFPYAAISLMLLVVLFFKSVSEGISFATILLIRGLYAPRYNKTGDDLENLWAARVCVFMLVAIVIACGLICYRFLDLYYLLGLFLLSSVPIMLNLLGLSRSWWLDLSAYGLMLLWCLGLNVPGVPSLWPLFNYPDLSAAIVCISSTVVVAYGLIYLSGILLTRRL